MTQQWKSVRVRQEDYDLLRELQEDLQKEGVGLLPKDIQDHLDGLSAGSVMGASLQLLKKELTTAKDARRGRAARK